MINGQYPTPSQSKLFIDDIWIDDAHQVDYREENARIPIYGYNRAQFIKVAHGKELITGNVVINYRFPNYLGHAIVEALRNKKTVDARLKSSKVGDPTKLKAPEMNRKELRDTLREMKRTDATGRLKMLAEAMDKGSFHQLSGLSRVLWDRDLADLPGEEFDPVRISSQVGGFNMVLTYGHVTGKSVVETIEECYITGRGKSMTASSGGGGASSSGSVIYEVYPFVARTVQTKVVDFSQRSLS
jgi:hypothetical protein